MDLKVGGIKQAGRYDGTLNLGSEFTELVSAHNKALSVIDFIKTSLGSNTTKGMEEDRVEVESQGTKRQPLVPKEEREKGSVGSFVYWKYITTTYEGALVPCILIDATVYKLLQVSSNYCLAWASPVSQGEVPLVGGSTLKIVYVGLAFGNTFFLFIRALCLTTSGYKTTDLLSQIKRSSKSIWVSYVIFTHLEDKVKFWDAGIDKPHTLLVYCKREIKGNWVIPSRYAGILPKGVF